jgi:hypothetical protein
MPSAGVLIRASLRIGHSVFPTEGVDFPGGAPIHLATRLALS